jgi:hypothetical protein
MIVDIGDMTIDSSAITRFHIYNKVYNRKLDTLPDGVAEGDAKYCVAVFYRGREKTYCFPKISERDEFAARIRGYMENQRRGSMDYLKGYFEKHQDQIITLGIVILLDHILFDGLFRDRLKGMVEKLIGTVETSMGGKKDV